MGGGGLGRDVGPQADVAAGKQRRFYRCAGGDAVLLRSEEQAVSELEKQVWWMRLTCGEGAPVMVLS